MVGTGKQFHEEYPIYDDVRTIRVRSFTFLDKESGVGYGQTSVYDLQDVKGDGK